MHYLDGCSSLVMNFDRLTSKIIKFALSLLIILFGVNPVFAGANVATKGEGDEVPSYVRSDITGFDFHGEDLHLSSINYIVPLQMGGETEITNMGISCQGCSNFIQY